MAIRTGMNVVNTERKEERDDQDQYSLSQNNKMNGTW